MLQDPYKYSELEKEVLEIFYDFAVIQMHTMVPLFAYVGHESFVVLVFSSVNPFIIAFTAP